MKNCREIKPSEISVYRSKAKAEAEGGSTKGGATSKGVATKAPPAAKAKAATGQTAIAAVLHTARTLVDQLGKEEAKKVIDLL